MRTTTCSSRPAGPHGRTWFTPIRSTTLTLLALSALLGTVPAARAHSPADQQIEAVSRAIEAHPDDPHAWLERGELHRIEGDFASARADYARAEALAPGLPETGLCRAALALDAGDPSRALALVDGVLAVAGDRAAAWRLRARVAATLGRSGEAVAALDRLVALDPHARPEDYVERARLQAGSGPAGLEAALRGLDEGMARLGPVPGLEAMAIELELRRDPGNPPRERIERLATTMSGGAVADAPTPARGDAGAEARLDPVVSASLVRGPYLQMATPWSIVVRWRTNVPSDGTVWYGPVAGQLHRVAEDPVFGTEHEVTLTGLAPDHAYHYAIGTTDGPLAGAPAGFGFRTPPNPGHPHPTRLWIIGDSGTGDERARAVRNMFTSYGAHRPADLWLMLGDNAYPSGTDAQYQNAVFLMYPEELRTMPLWPTRGNHDQLYAGSGNDYYDIFTMPTQAEAGGVPSGTEAYYSFDWANIHFICLDSEGSDRSPTGPMLTWLAADLAATRQDWIVAFWHHPPYTKGSHNSDNAGDSGGRMRDMRQNALPLLESANVDLVLTGHSHSYERSFLLEGHYGTSNTLSDAMKIDPGDGRPDGDGAYMKLARDLSHSPNHVVDAQGAVYTVAGSSGQVGGGALNHPVMVSNWRLLGSMILDVDDLVMEARFLTAFGVIDSFSIVKSRHGHGPIARNHDPVEGGAATPSSPRLELAPVTPNPASAAVRFAFTLPEATTARLSIVDVTGREIAAIADGALPAGRHDMAWTGATAGGRAAPGVYFARLRAGTETLTRRFVIAP